MSNLKISQLPEYSGSTAGSWLIANNAVETGTYKIQRENFLSGYALTSSLTALSSSIATTDLNQNNTIATLATTSSLTALSSSIAVTDLGQNNTIATLATTSSLTALSSSIATTDLSQNNRLTTIESRYATTGSNVFRGNQTITGSLIASGSSHKIVGITNITGSLNQSGDVTLFGTTPTNGRNIYFTNSGYTIASDITYNPTPNELNLNNSTNGGTTNITAISGTVRLFGNNIIGSGSLTVSGSAHKVVGNTTLTGSLNVTGSITGSADGTFNDVKIGRGFGNLSSNTIVSRNAFGNNTTGLYNTIFGDANLGLSSTGNENTIIGWNNMNAATNANSNIAIGLDVMRTSVSPGANIGIGRKNLEFNLSGSNNVSVGLYSMQYSTGSRNVAVGESALSRALNDNIGIGYNAGEFETGSSKLYIDTVDRADLNSAISGAILYGEMNSVPANQNLRINSKATILNGLNIEGGGISITGSLTASGSLHRLIGNTTITGSLNVTSGATISGSIITTGSVQGNVFPLSISSNTASLNLDNGNFFTLQLVGGQATHLTPSNIKPGQTVSLFVNTTGSAIMTFPSSIKQMSGSAYTPTIITGLDVLTFISKDSSNLYMVSAKNFI